MKAIIQFGKQGRLRFISHLDLQRFMQRALRRTGLPVAYSQGFNPHALLSFASALGMGVSSEAELLEVRFAEPVAEQTILEAMRAALPPEMPVYRVRAVDDRFPSLMATVYCADYRMTLTGEGAKAIADAVPGYLEKTEVMAVRKTKSGEKTVNIRPSTLELRAEGTEDGAYALTARLTLTPEDTLKPDVLLGALARLAGVPEEDYEARIHRTLLSGKTAKGEIVPLFDWKC